MKTTRLLVTLATLFSLCQSALAQEDNREAYAVLDDDGLLTFYYNTNKPSSGTVYDIPWNTGEPEDDSDPGWVNYNFDENDALIGNTAITSVAFDASFSDYNLKSAYDMFATCTALTSIDFTNFNTSNVVNMAYMFFGCKALTSLDLRNFNTSEVIDMNNMFCDCSNLETIYCYDDWSIDRSDDFISYEMFSGCVKLPDYSDSFYNDITFAKPISEGGYFNNLQAYATIANGNLTFFYDENKPASGSFELTNTGGGSWKDASFSSVTFDESIKDYKFTSTAGMFSGLTNLTVINYLTYLNTSTITDMSNMFSGCSSLATIYCNNDWSSLSIPSNNMFLGCTQLDGYNANNVSITYANPTEGGYFTPYIVAYAELNEGTLTFYYDLLRGTRQGIVYDLPWEDYYPEWYIQDPEEGEDEEDNEEAPVRKAMARTMNSDITMVVFDDSFHDFDGFTSTKNMFFDLSNLETIEGLENLNTENVTNMSKMFQGCESLTALDLSGFNTGKVTDMNYMFSYCSSLTTLDLSNFITGNVTDMNNMFENCEALTSLDVTNFNTENVTKMNGMFTFCEALTSLDLTNFNTGNVEYMDYMFSHCSSITSLDLTNFDVTKVKRVECMFANCSNLATIFCNDDWADKGMSRDMFLNCENLVGAKSYSSSHVVWGNTVANPTKGYFTYGIRDYADNSSLIASTPSMPRVGLVGRTLYKTGDWNTLCLPFSVGDSNPNDGLTFSGTPLEGATVMTLDNSADSETGFDPSSGTLTLNFVEANSIEAGTPYIVKWENTGETIEDPTFTNVTLSSTLSPVVAPSVTFMGNYDPQPFTSANSNILYLGAGNTLYYPSSDMTINAFRAYFQLNLTSGQQVKAINLNFGDEETGIFLMEDGRSKMEEAWYSLDGRRLLDKPTQKGMYINNGRKVLIK